MNIAELEHTESMNRVTSGAEWLDEEVPGWERLVDLSILDITDPSSCICGQVLKGGWDSLLYEYHKLGSWMSGHGFLFGEDTDQWVALIKDRFDTGAFSDL